MAGEAPTDKSMFHGKSLKDYAGRSWLEAPKDLKAENEHCFLPKRWIHTWSGHTKGVNAIRCCLCAFVLLAQVEREEGGFGHLKGNQVLGCIVLLSDPLWLGGGGI